MLTKRLTEWEFANGDFGHFYKKNCLMRKQPKQFFNDSPSPPSEMVSDRPLERFIFGVAVETSNNEKG